MLDSHAPVERALQRLCTALQEDAEAERQPILLVLDDLHFIESPAVHALIATCLEHGPADLHFILLARRRTALPLARLVAHGKIVALDAEDLRFTEEEVAAYLQSRGFLPPTGAELAELTVRSEGWITALQLAVLALRERSAVHDLLDVLHGANTWLADFLTDEVLDRQPPELRHFLLQTSLLDAFNAELCAAVTGMADAYGKLAAIARADLFLIPLDGKGWFRYHHLFQELLQHRLQAQRLPPLSPSCIGARPPGWRERARSTAPYATCLPPAPRTRRPHWSRLQLRAMLLRDPYQAQSLLALLPSGVVMQRPQLMLDRCRIAVLFDDRQALSYTQEAELTLQMQCPPIHMRPDTMPSGWCCRRAVLSSGAIWPQQPTFSCSPNASISPGRFPYWHVPISPDASPQACWPRHRDGASGGGGPGGVPARGLGGRRRGAAP